MHSNVFEEQYVVDMVHFHEKFRSDFMSLLIVVNERLFMCYISISLPYH